MVIEALNTEYVSKEEKTTVDHPPSKADLIKIQIIEEYIAIASAYLKTVNNNYRKATEQDRDNERAIKAKKSSTKGLAQTEMEALSKTNQGRASGNSYVAKESDAGISTSGSVGFCDKSDSITLSPSYA